MREKIDKKTARVGVIGLGYVGLPLVDKICEAGFRTTGFDVDLAKNDKLNKGVSYIPAVSSEDMANHVEQRRFDATDDFSRLREIDIILICVPTPLTEHLEPDLRYVENTARGIAKTLREGQLVILESTSYPGTTREVVKPILEETGLKSGADFLLAFSPEREDPGNTKYGLAHIPKVVGGDTRDALDAAVQFYDCFVEQTVPVSSLDTAEAVKLTENIFRSVNIALVNELKMIYSRMGVDIWEVIEAAKTKPFGFMAFYPGPGIGGHCIPVDPFYLTWKAREYDISTRFIELAGQINAHMPAMVLEQLAVSLDRKTGKGLNRSKILVVGVSYKKNVGDIRETPAFPFMKLLEERNAAVSYYDPFVPAIHWKLRRYPEYKDMRSIVWSPEALQEFDAAIIITDHDDVNYQMLADYCPLVIDTRNAMKGVNAVSENIVKA
jgi:UDP-N-acetyl-D-glucosamine dehydrogenase